MMTNKFALVALMAMTAAPTAMPSAAFAQEHHRTYHGRNGHYRQRCRGGDGAVGTVAGGAGGALLGHALGGGLLGTVAGGVGGGLLGRHLDKQNSRKRNGC